MKTEKFGAAEPAESPQRRYASLHRCIEAGSASDRTWYDLMEVCLTLDKPDEAMTACGCISDAIIRERAERTLLHRGKPSERQAVLADQPGIDSPESQQTAEEDSIGENILDAFRFLFAESMPLTVIFATLTFPLVVGFGGFLTRDSHALVLPLIAMIPALSVVGLVGALGRRILLDAQSGLDDAPTIPGIRTLTRDAGRFLVDASILSLVFLAPGLLISQLESVSVLVWMTTLAFGSFMMPMSLAIRAVTDDWRCLSPNVLFAAVTRCGRRYAAFAACSVGLLLPAGISAYYAAGSQVYLQVSVVGPLLVAPLFIVARLLGQMLCLHRRELDDLLVVTESNDERSSLKERLEAKINAAKQRRAAAAEANKTAREERRAARTALTAEGHPEAAQPTGAQQQQQQQPRKAARKQPAPAKNPARPAQRRPAAAAPAQQRPAAAPGEPIDQYGNPRRAAPEMVGVGAGRSAVQRTAAPPSASNSAPATRVEVEEVADPSAGTSMPDLSQIPGAHIVRGDDRVRAGASAPDMHGRRHR